MYTDLVRYWEVHVDALELSGYALLSLWIRHLIKGEIFTCVDCQQAMSPRGGGSRRLTPLTTTGMRAKIILEERLFVYDNLILQSSTVGGDYDDWENSWALPDH
jgi:hypothetical protein